KSSGNSTFTRSLDPSEWAPWCVSPVAATVRSRDEDARGWPAASLSFVLESSACDLTVAATLNRVNSMIRRSTNDRNSCQPRFTWVFFALGVSWPAEDIQQHGVRHAEA